MEYYQIPRRKVTEHFGVARSSLYRWLHRLDDPQPKTVASANKTPDEIAALVWDIAKNNIGWGRTKIANQLKLLGVFLSASTVRNILSRPEPPYRESAETETEVLSEEAADPRSVPAFYPNHVWSMDFFTVYLWGLWKTNVLVIIDHFSRRLICVRPMKRKTARATIRVIEDAFYKFGPPKHVITDKDGPFISTEYKALIRKWLGRKPRYGAIGKHGSIAVTERVIKTLRYEGLVRIPLIRGFGHLCSVCSELVHWYDFWRPHMTLNGFTPDDFYRRDYPEPVPHDAKNVPTNIERRVFKHTRITGYRLKYAA